MCYKLGAQSLQVIFFFLPGREGLKCVVELHYGKCCVLGSWLTLCVLMMYWNNCSYLKFPHQRVLNPRMSGPHVQPFSTRGGPRCRLKLPSTSGLRVISPSSQNRQHMDAATKRADNTQPGVDMEQNVLVMHLTALKCLIKHGCWV